MSDTPRTDAILEIASIEDRYRPLLDLARDLERELALAKAAVITSEAACDENKSWHSETGWVIVTEGAGRLVYFSGSLLIPNDDPLRAVRFARQEDAERIRAALVAGELVASHMDAEERARRSVVTNWLNSRVEEHEWCGPSEQSKPCGDGCRGCAYCRQESSAPPETPPPTCTEREKR